MRVPPWKMNNWVGELWRNELFTCYVTLLSNLGDLGASAILANLDHKKYLSQLISYLDPVVPNAYRSEFVRCWHAKTDGWAASKFHSNCDGKGPTVTIIKVNNNIFGGYTDVSWSSEYILSVNLYCCVLKL